MKTKYYKSINVTYSMEHHGLREEIGDIYTVVNGSLCFWNYIKRKWEKSHFFTHLNEGLHSKTKPLQPMTDEEAFLYFL